MKLETYAHIPVNVEINNYDAIHALIENIFHQKGLSNIVEKDNALYREIDVSMHGSPVYEYELVTKKPKLIAVYHHLVDLYKLIDEIK